MKISERVFRRVISNIVLAVVIAAVFGVAFAGDIKAVVTSGDVCQPYYNGKTDTNNVSLMVNVYWGNDYIEPMLEILDTYGVKITFFIGGMWAERYPELLKMIVSHGHEIGNHGYYHKDQDELDYNGNIDEIGIAGKMIESACGVKTVLFAPPSGAFNKQTLKAAEDLGYKTIMWSKDTVDWRDKDADVIFKRATSKVKGGDLILMHPTEATVKALSDILEFYKTNGFNVCPVSENIE